LPADQTGDAQARDGGHDRKTEYEDKHLQRVATAPGALKMKLQTALIVP
jgi:hypothetical protein